MNILADNDASFNDGTGIADSAITTDKIAADAVTPPKLDLSVQAAAVDTSQNTTSTTYTDLATAGPAVTITVPASGKIFLSFGAQIANSSDTQSSFLTLAVSGANTVAAADSSIYTLRGQASGNSIMSTMCKAFVVTGLTPGSTTFTMKYRAGGSTATYIFRYITAFGVE